MESNLGSRTWFRIFQNGHSQEAEKKNEKQREITSIMEQIETQWFSRPIPDCLQGLL